jgi:hypothetical protein
MVICKNTWNPKVEPHFLFIAVGYTEEKERGGDGDEIQT